MVLITVPPMAGHSVPEDLGPDLLLNPWDLRMQYSITSPVSIIGLRLTLLCSCNLLILSGNSQRGGCSMTLVE